MRIKNVADLPDDEFVSCIECRKRFEDDRKMKKIIFERKIGQHTTTHPIYLCYDCYKNLFQWMYELDGFMWV